MTDDEFGINVDEDDAEEMPCEAECYHCGFYIGTENRAALKQACAVLSGTGNCEREAGHEFDIDYENDYDGSESLLDFIIR